VGLDQVAAEVFTNLVTGAILPETGDIRVFGRPTSAIADSDDWLATVDRFGIVSERAVLLDQLSVLQNLRCRSRSRSNRRRTRSNGRRACWRTKSDCPNRSGTSRSRRCLSDRVFACGWDGAWRSILTC
jgi:hypothetical protein